MARDTTLTYMTVAEFNQLGARIAGDGWQKTLAEYLGYSRQHVSLFANGDRPIPPLVACHLRCLAERLDQGIPVIMPEPVGRIVQIKGKASPPSGLLGGLFAINR